MYLVAMDYVFSLLFMECTLPKTIKIGSREEGRTTGKSSGHRQLTTLGVSWPHIFAIVIVGVFCGVQTWAE